MKKLLLISLILFAFSGAAFAYTDTAVRIQVDFGDPDNRNVVVTYGDIKTLIHYTGLCTKPETGDFVTLGVRDRLDGIGDSLKTGDYHACDIDQAEQIDEILKVEGIYGADTTLLVSDETKNLYRIYFSSTCSAVKGYLHQNIYARLYGSTLTKGDRFYLPRNQLQCGLNYVETLSDEDMSNPNQTVPSIADIAEQNKDALTAPIDSHDTKRPTAAGDPRAISGNGKVYVYWKAATDDKGVDHYVVVYSKYRQNIRKLTINDLSTYVTSTKTSAEIPNLQVDLPYYFYVKAVDAAGNESSDWTVEVTATPRSISVIGTPESTALNLKQTIENSGSFLFRWNRTTAVQRQSVILEVDGTRDFTSNDWANSYIWISKKDARKGKPLTLTVRTYGMYGQMAEETIEFSF